MGISSKAGGMVAFPGRFIASRQYRRFLLWIVAMSVCLSGFSGHAFAEETIVEPIVYQNTSQPGPPLVVLPGHFKSSNAAFSQKFTTNNIADFAEIELSKANFKVLERADLGPLLAEVTLAANMGDPNGLIKFRKGKFITTRWFVQFDVLKAEPVAEAASGFDGKALGNLISTVAGDKLGGRVVGSAVSSAGSSDEAMVWIIGLRYKIIDASSSAILSSKYIEEKMEVGGSSATFMGISQSEKNKITLDSMVQRLVQKCVAEIDKNKGISAAVAVASGHLGGVETTAIRDDALSVITPHPDGQGQATEYNPKHTAAVQPENSMAGKKDYRMAGASNCQELLKTLQLGDSSVMQRYLKECTK
jgi:hypothetical protein